MSIIFYEEYEYHHFIGRRVSYIEYELYAFHTISVVIGSDRELTTEIIDSVIIESDSKLQFDGHPSFTVAEIPIIGCIFNKVSV